jgi:hypothetical protein
VGALRGIEQRIESLVEGIFGRAFRAHVQPVEIARKLVKEMDDHRSVSISRIYVPNEYVVYLAPKDREQFQAYEGSLTVELADYLAEHARREGYALLSAPRVLIQEDADLEVGEFGIATRLVEGDRLPDAARSSSAQPPPVAPAAAAAEVAKTRVFAPPPEPERPPTLPPPPPRKPILMIDGAPRELAQGVMTIGRSHECDLAIEDPSVSRRHAELRVEDDAVWLVDLRSTNGTEVNGRRTDRARLEPGDQIVIGQTELLFDRR